MALHPKNKRLAVLLLLAGSFSVSQVHAAVTAAPIFSDDMVLQREKPLPVWGTAKPGENVSVTLGERHLTTVTDVQGRWQITFPPLSLGAPLTLTIKGENTLVFQNVAIGDVYLCSGQSNMDFRLREAKDADTEITAANYPDIRFLAVPKKIAVEPMATFAAPAPWSVCTPQSAADFSAVGYFFGRALHQNLKIPIGLINASWGGTIAQAWTSRDTLLKNPELREITIAAEKKTLATTDATIQQDIEDWKERADDGAKNGWQNGEFDDSTWATMKLPTKWEESGLPDYDGVVWFRKRIEIPAGWEGKALILHLGVTDDIDTTYWNGTRIGFGNQSAQVRRYPIPAVMVKAGTATIAVRVHDYNRDGGLTGGEPMRLEWQDDATQKIDISGDWRYHTGKNVKEWPPGPGDIRYDNSQPSVLYNGMIAPLVPLPVRGVIWYQGESDTPRPVQYRTLFPDLIRDWRAHWGAKQDGSEFGFYYVQIANYLARTPQPIESGWAELRDAQTMALAIPRTGMATILDIGEGNNIHPLNKQDVGKRLALIALTKEYNQKTEFSGPMLQRVKIEADGKTARILWSHAVGLKTSDGQPPRCFAIQSEDGQWHTANAHTDGQTVVLSGETRITAIRYAWANNPDVNLINEARLPAVPFRTDK